MSDAGRIKQPSNPPAPRHAINQEPAEAEMRRALYGKAEVSAPIVTTPKDTAPDTVIVLPPKPAAIKNLAKTFTPRLEVMLRIGNGFWGAIVQTDS